MSDVSDAEGRLLALTDQLHRRQLEAHRLKLEHRRINKEKLKSHESALLRQIEVIIVFSMHIYLLSHLSAIMCLAKLCKPNFLFCSERALFFVEK